MVDRNRVATAPITPHGLDADGNPEAVNSTSNALHVANMAAEPGGDDLFDAVWGGARMRKTSLSADGQIGVAGPCYYYGYLVTTGLGAGVINVRDAIAAGSGDIVDIVAASAAAGVQNRLPGGVYCPNGVYADFASTGTATFFYWQ
jgi:hypothetical protein